MDERWLRNELAHVHDRLEYLAGEVRLRNPALPGDAGREFPRLLKAAALAVEVGVRYLDRQVLEEPTVVCPICRMIARVQDGWRVCDYCGASEPIALPDAVARTILTRANLDGPPPAEPCRSCGRGTVTVNPATGYCQDCESLHVG